MELERLRELKELLTEYWVEYGDCTFYGDTIKTLLEPVMGQIKRREKELIE